MGDFHRWAIVRYISPMCREAPWTNLHEIWNSGSSPGRNQLWQIFWQLVKGFRVYRGSNFGILYWLSQSPLIQWCATARLWFLKKPSKSPEIDVVDNPTVIWRPTQGNSANIRIYLIFIQTRVIYLPLSSFTFFWWAQKDIFAAIECASAVQSHLRSMILVPIKSAYATFY